MNITKKEKRKERNIILDFKLSRLSNYIFVILRVLIVFLIHCSTSPCVSMFRVHFSLFLQGRPETRFTLTVSFMSANWNKAQYSTKNIVEIRRTYANTNVKQKILFPLTYEVVKLYCSKISIHFISQQKSVLYLMT